MCIRDSPDTECIAVGMQYAIGNRDIFAGFGLLQASLVGTKGNAVIAGINDAIGSVSYTHLRAHETVLDLVCRLLLEKKK